MEFSERGARAISSNRCSIRARLGRFMNQFLMKWLSHYLFSFL